MFYQLENKTTEDLWFFSQQPFDVFRTTVAGPREFAATQDTLRLLKTLQRFFLGVHGSAMNISRSALSGVVGHY